jgi:hypothetical protein
MKRNKARIYMVRLSDYPDRRVLDRTRAAATAALRRDGCEGPLSWRTPCAR